MSMRAPRTVQRAAFLPGVEDAHGNVRDAWGPVVDVVVRSWAPPSADTVPPASGRDPVVRDLDLYANVDVPNGPRDHWMIPGQPVGACPDHPMLPCLEQVGHAEDYSAGPFRSVVGALRINLKRVEG